MQFIKKLFVYFVGTVFNKLIIFILLPIYTRYLSPTDYGNADLSLTTVTMLTSLLFMEVWTPLLRFSYDCKTKDEKKKGSYVKKRYRSCFSGFQIIEG